MKIIHLYVFVTYFGNLKHSITIKMGLSQKSLYPVWFTNLQIVPDSYELDLSARSVDLK